MDQKGPLLAQPIIATTPKEEEAILHKYWVLSLPPGTILLYRDGSKTPGGITGSAWYCISMDHPHLRPTVLFEGQCQIGDREDIEDGEIHAIQEGLTRLNTTTLGTASRVYICADNQNALRALAGGPTAGREYIVKCLGEAEVLHQKGYRIQGKCTPSHQKIAGNEKTDTLAKAGCNEPSCKWARTTLTWLRARPKPHLIEQWQTEHALRAPARLTAFAATRTIPRRFVQGIARLRCPMTIVDKSPVGPPTTCKCNTAELSGRHLLLH